MSEQWLLVRLEEKLQSGLHNIYSLLQRDDPSLDDVIIWACLADQPLYCFNLLTNEPMVERLIRVIRRAGTEGTTASSSLDYLLTYYNDQWIKPPAIRNLCVLLNVLVPKPLNPKRGLFGCDRMMGGEPLELLDPRNFSTEVEACPNIVEIIERNIEKQSNLGGVCLWIGKHLPEYTTECKSSCLDVSSTLAQVYFVSPDYWWDASGDPQLLAPLEQWQWFLPQWRCTGLLPNNDKCPRFSGIGDLFCAFHGKDMPKRTLRWAFRPIRDEADRFVTHQYKKRPMENESTRYTISKRPILSTRTLKVVSSQNFPDDLWLPIVRYNSLYYSQGSSASFVYCGKFFFYEPESHIYIRLRLLDCLPPRSTRIFSYLARCFPFSIQSQTNVFRLPLKDNCTRPYSNRQTTYDTHALVSIRQTTFGPDFKRLLPVSTMLPLTRNSQPCHCFIRRLTQRHNQYSAPSLTFSIK